MHDLGVIQDIVIILLVSLPIVFIFKKINIPAIVGFLISGILIGPYGFGLIHNIGEIEVMAEIGVVLLLFTIGLEVSFSELIKNKKLLLVAGGLQVCITIALSALIFYVLQFNLSISIFFGMLLSLSSTAIVLKLLAERIELEAPHGKISLSILIFQDIAVVPFFLLLPILGSDAPLSIGEISIKLIAAFGALGIILVLSKYLMPKIMYQLANLRMREAFTIGTILILLGTAYLTYSLGLSLALGAFIAGLILAESEYSHQIISDILPLKDSFNSIFFVSVGLLLNISFVFDFPVLIAVVTVSVILFKALIILGIITVMKYPVRVGLLTALGLAQIGEFSFVLAQAGSKFYLIAGEQFNIFLASSIFTMIITPFLFRLAPVLAFGAIDIFPQSPIDSKKEKKLTGHVIIAGFGLNGQNLARVLKETGINYIITELNPDTVKKEKANGQRIIFGDISKEEVLLKTGIKTAKVLVYAISDPLTTKRSLRLVKQLNPEIFTVVRTRFVNEIEELNILGADSVIPEEFETSLEIFRNVLLKYHIPLNIIMKQTSLLRSESYKMLRKSNEESGAFIHIDEILAQGLTESFYVNEGNPLAGKSLGEINLRAHTDATIIAIVRNGKNIANPSGKEKVLASDTLVITGTHFSVDAAINILNGKTKD
jgi:CPA2 family monovalent cation:H+ antiporter-2